MNIKIYKLTLTAILATTVFSFSTYGQKLIREKKSEEAIAAVTSREKGEEKNAPEDYEGGSSQKYRLLQSNEFFVETPYLQEKSELEHTFTIMRKHGEGWSMEIRDEMPLFSEKHQLSFSLPAQITTAGETGRGVGDMSVEYNYALIGGSTSRVAVSPGVGVTFATGNFRKNLGSGGTGISFKLPVGVMLNKRFASISAFETTFTHGARNDDGDKANTFGYEFGQSFVWMAKPKLNFLVETVWERAQVVSGPNLKEYENELFVSPGVRWAHVMKNGLIIAPGFAVPIGVGPSKGEYGLFFYIAFEHSFRKED